MLNRIQGGSNPDSNKLANKYKPKTSGLKLAPAVLAALLSTQAKAENWVCGIDADYQFDGTTSKGTTINDGSNVYMFDGQPAGVGFRGLSSGGTFPIERISDDRDITSDIEASDVGLVGGDFELSGYNPDTDELMVIDWNTASFG